jgi:hypothetical protein
MCGIVNDFLLAINKCLWHDSPMTKKHTPHTALGKIKKPVVKKPRITVGMLKDEIQHLQEALQTQASWNQATESYIAAVTQRTIKLPFGYKLIKPAKTHGQK